jgi:KDO2-lipid IV(A) lauroyltransferase
VKNAPVRHALEYGLYLAFKGLLRALPHPATRTVGRALGLAFWALDARHRRIAFDNLGVLGLAPAERRRITRRCFAHFGAAICDTISSSRFDAVALCERLTLEGFEHLQAAEAAGKGVVVMSAHLGLWEIAAYPPGLYGGPMQVVVRPLDNPHLDRELTWLRERFGNRLIPKHGAARPMLRTLASGGRLGILIDQRVQRHEGIELPFFGRPALTSPVLAKLSLRTGAPVVPIAGYPEEGGRYRVVFRPPIWPSGGDDEANVATLTARYLAAVEAEIRPQPELWLWLHRRWRTDR